MSWSHSSTRILCRPSSASVPSKASVSFHSGFSERLTTRVLRFFEPMCTAAKGSELPLKSLDRRRRAWTTVCARQRHTGVSGPSKTRERRSQSGARERASEKRRERNRNLKRRSWAGRDKKR
eukprot:1698329-Pleurochrysis_carterae.AAC.1